MPAKDAESELIRGNIDPIVLRTLSEGSTYGYEVLKRICTASGGAYEMKEPSLYTSLKRLEKLGFVKSYWGSESQGARRKYYYITEAGTAELAEAKERWVRIRDIIDRLLLSDGGEQ